MRAQGRFGIATVVVARVGSLLVAAIDGPAGGAADSSLARAP